MSPRKAVRITDPSELPTIKDYFGMMAEEQAEDIRRLKRAATGKKSGYPKRPPADKAVPDAWLMHPVRRTKKSAAKSGAKNTKRSIAKKASKKGQKKAAKTASKRARR
jgi:hypothetical protein